MLDKIMSSVKMNMSFVIQYSKEQYSTVCSSNKDYVVFQYFSLEY